MTFENPKSDDYSPTAEKIDSLFPSSDLCRSVNSINSLSADPEVAIVHKQRTAIEIRERKLLEDKILSEGATIDVASGTDIAYPLSLGSRHIVMVDPIFADDVAKEEVKQVVSSITGELPQETASGLEFAFDFGDGGETVRVEFSPAIYGSQETYERVAPTTDKKAQDWQELIAELEGCEKDGKLDKIIAGQSVFDGIMIPIQPEVAQRFKNREGEFAPDYTPPLPQERPKRFHTDQPVAMLLGFRTTGIELLDDKDAARRILKGGYVLTERPEDFDSNEYEQQNLRNGLLLRKK